MMLSWTSARGLACECIRRAQKRYKKQHDKSAVQRQYKIGEWVLVRFPQEEQGKTRKLSRPWHGPYRVTEHRDTDVTITKVYFPQESAIQVHQSRVCLCPPAFPAGYYWYGNKRMGPGRPPKWVDKLLSDETFAEDQSHQEEDQNCPTENSESEDEDHDVCEQPPV